MSKSKQKGTKAETAVVNYLNDKGILARRNPPAGARDVGDIDISLPLVIEVKDHVRMELSEWIKEAQVERDNAGAKVGIVWHKKRGTTDPGNWYVTMTGQDFVTLISMVGTVY